MKTDIGKVPGEVHGQLMLEKVPGEQREKLILEKCGSAWKTVVGKGAWYTA